MWIDYDVEESKKLAGRESLYEYATAVIRELGKRCESMWFAVKFANFERATIIEGCKSGQTVVQTANQIQMR